MEKYERYLIEKAFSRNTIESYLFAIRQMHERQGSHLSNKNLLEHKDWLVSNFAAKTANLRITAINSYLDFRGFEGIRLKGVRIQQKPFLDNIISQEEYELLRTSLKADGEMFWYFIIRFIACSGARVSELRLFTVESVRCGHLDLVSKGQKLRRIYLPTSLCEEALDWLNTQGKASGYVFSHTSKKPMTARGISLGLKRCAKKYGINPDVVYPHSFRHRFAKNFIEQCSDIAFLADLMGHDSIETTRVYLRRTSEEQRSAVDAIVDW